MAFDDFIYFEKERLAQLEIAKYGFATYLQSLPIWNKPIPAMRAGDTGVGYTFEQLVGVDENNLKLPDIQGYEVKAQVSKGSMVTLFTRNPTAPLRAVHKVLEMYGRLDDGIKRFNTNLIVGRNTRFADSYLTINVNEQDQQIEVVSGDNGIVAYWTFDDIRHGSGKLERLVLIQAKSSSDELGITGFHYDRYRIFDGFIFDAFIGALMQGIISIHFRIKGRITAAKNKGTAFRIREQDMPLLYRATTHWFKST